MNNFEVLDHPADIGIKVKGETLEELFINAAIGTSSLIIDLKAIEQKEIKKINLQGKNLEDLFIKCLDEIIYLFDSEGFLPKSVKVETIHELSLRAIFQGGTFNKNKHEIKLYFKAGTYHQLEIKQTKEGWEAKVYFDV